MKALLFPYREGVMTCLWEDRAESLAFFPPERSARVGSIYRGTVEQMVPGLEAAFVRFGAGEKGYLPLKRGESLKPGLELTVQVEKAAVKTKLPVLTRALTLPGRFLVLLSAGKGLAVSRKLEGRQGEEAAEEALAPYLQEQGFILRTNGGEAAPEQLQQEAARLIEELRQIRGRESHAPAGSLLREAEPEHISFLRGLPGNGISEILAEGETLIREVRSYLEQEEPERLSVFREYRDESLSLARLYNLEREVERAQEKRVWLPCGGYLVIEPTEALVAIDVNSGKYETDSFADTVRLVNFEAAAEAARQLRLRNLSGMILLDFIRMKKPEEREELLTRLKEEVGKDTVRCEVLGYTALGLVEMTRRRLTPSLREQLAQAEHAAPGPAARR